MLAANRRSMLVAIAGVVRRATGEPTRPSAGLATVAFLTWLSVGGGNVWGAPFVPQRNAQGVAVSADGRLVATAKSGMSNSEFPPRPHPTIEKCGLIQVWDAASGKMLARMQTYGDFTRLRFSPDGSRLVSCRLYTPGDGLEMSEVQVWDVATGKSLQAFDRCHGFAISPAGDTLAVLSRTRCVLYDAATFEKVKQIEPLGRAISIEFTPDGSSLLGIQPVGDRFQIIRCDVASRQVVARSSEVDGAFYTLAMAPAQPLVATGHPGMIVLWDRQGLTPVRKFETLDRGLQYPFLSPTGQWLGAGSQTTGDVEFFDLEVGKSLQRYTFQRGTLHTYHPRTDNDRICPERDPGRFVFLPDGESFLAGCFGGMVRLVSNGQEVRRFEY